MNTYPWIKLVSELSPYAGKPVGSVRIDTADIRAILYQNQLRLTAAAVLQLCHDHFLQVDDMEEEDHLVVKVRTVIEALSND